MKKETIINIIKLVILLIVFFFSGTIMAYIFKLFGVSVIDFNYIDISYYEALIEIVLGLIIFFIYQKYIVKDIKIFNDNQDNNLKKCIKLFWIFLLIKIIAASVTIIISSILNVNIGASENQTLVDAYTKASPLVMFISAVIFAPFVEEGIFRLGFRKAIKNNNVFIVLSGLVFGLMHIFPTDINLTVALITSISYITMGITLAYMYKETNNIWFTIIIHALNNFIGIISIIFMT